MSRLDRNQFGHGATPWGFGVGRTLGRVARILLVCGSLGGASANRRALDVVAERLATHEGVIVDRLDDVGPIPPLDPAQQDPPPVVVGEWLGQIAAADAVVIAAPEYAGALAGVAKNALDWVVGGGQLYAKPVVVLSAGTTGGQQARIDLVRTLSWQGAHVVGHLGIAAPKTKSDADGRFTDPATVAELHGLADLAAAAPLLDGQHRLVLVRATTEWAGVGAERIAPI